MEYTVQQLAKIAGISARTLRYYDEIDLLKPARINSSGYRIYGRREVDRLQQILFYRELGVSLERIKAIVSNPSFDKISALKEHREKLLMKRNEIDKLLTNIDNTLLEFEGGRKMTDRERFEGFKKALVEENENQYGKEAREKFGDQKVEDANKKLLNMSENDYETITELTEQINETLARALQTGDPAGDLAQKTARLHKQWLTFYWGDYSKKAHAGIADLYVEDERFKAYYEKVAPGAAQFLREAIHYFTGLKQ
ncbi:MerR family transcriptional regulator [Fervidibacillus albus]|uniref:MerR family transcriptional regulator n=1 Tax=Fervidibacillus albus TaxID=2980026 RepID=A0A9E8RXB8_9BACI|nr:MerR family transcriptional regulator [Fervidibacillus albus]WAA10998.1 MerR family transcriptional regulator [Fervidibacillus albus]